MYQCSKKERQTYPIRPHHGMCLAFFIGNGYSTGFTAHMQEMLELFTKGADVCLTVKTDEICSACPNNSQGICEAAEKVKRYDNAVLAECGLKEGQKLAFPEFTEAVQKKIIETGKRTKICGDCQWGGAATQWRFEGWKNGAKTCEHTCTPGKRLHLEVTPSALHLTERQSWDAAAVRIRIADEQGNTASYAQLPVTLKLSGDAELVGPAVITAEGGMCGTYVKTAGKRGHARLVISAPQTESVTLEFEIDKENDI